jgi:type I restriction-modification system DNA methylase subunit
MSLFQKSVETKYLNELDSALIDKKFADFKAYFGNSEIQENIRNSKEEQFQEGFLRELFVKIFDYTLNPQPNFNLTTELKNVSNSRKADGAILKNDNAIAVIELKSTDTTDLKSVETQAFGYKNHHPKCVYVITSNFEKLRFYIQNAVNHLEFELFKLTREEFALLWLCIAKENLLNDLALKIKESSLAQEESITKKLYSDYSKFRADLYQNLVKNNPDIDKLTLFKKTQKLIDRFLFIFFAEDKQLLPANSIIQIIEKWKDDVDFGDIKPLYTIFRKYFHILNVGRPKSEKRQEIYAYNGGLFLTDEILERVLIDDSVLKEHTLKLSNYDFDTEVDVNILGHIFEHSLGEIENVQAEIRGEKVEKNKTKRKKDGIFYTPKYITKYIVEKTIGKLCAEKRNELEIVDEEYAKGRKNRRKETIKELDEKLKKYQEWLLTLTILDPACGSGAFLNQALEFLIEEHRKIDELRAQLFGVGIVFSDITASILEKNIFGVDLNEESVEIAKLSLWLRTAQKGRKLNTLSNNIKCGNSLIDDPSIAGEKAFNWEKEFPEILEKGGFDVVIGNPPYGILIDKNIQYYYEQNFPLTQYKTNLYILFIERMLQLFDKGIVHFIIPKSLLFNTYYETIRKELILKTELNEIFTITEKVFEDAEVGSSLLLQFTINKSPNLKNRVSLSVAEKIQNFISSFGLVENEVPQEYFLNIPNCEISVISTESQSILKKLLKLNCIKDFYTLKNGLNPGNIKHILVTDRKVTEKHKPIIWGKDISKYNISWSGQFVNYDENIAEQISLDDIKSKEGMNKQTRIDFALRSTELFENKKILVRKTGDSLIASLDENNYYFDTLVHGIYEKERDFSLEALLAILNSKPATLFYRMLHDIKGKVFAKISLDNLASFPIPKEIVSYSNILCELTNKMLGYINDFRDKQLAFCNLITSKFELETINNKIKDWYNLDTKEFLKELNKAGVKLNLSEESDWLKYFVEEKNKIQPLLLEIEKTENEINRIVYKLYDLEDDEIRILEEKV